MEQTPTGMKIFLLGLPGCGKTTLGKELASHLTLPFYDLDNIIEEKSGSTITHIFLTRGEQAFREIESFMLTEWCDSDVQGVMATGGGTPCFDRNMEVMNQAGLTLFLNVPLNTITSRLEKMDISERPLFKGFEDDVWGKLDLLLSKRIIHYKKSKVILKGDAISTDDLVQVVKQHMG